MRKGPSSETFFSTMMVEGEYLRPRRASMDRGLKAGACAAAGSGACRGWRCGLLLGRAVAAGEQDQQRKAKCGIVRVMRVAPRGRT